MYTTLENIKSELGIKPSDTDDDSYLERKIRVYSDMFDRLVGRRFEYEENLEERVSQPRGRRRLIVSRAPIKEVITIEDPEGDEIDADTYFIENDALGFVTKKKGVWCHTGLSTRNISRLPTVQNVSSYVVTYTGGFVTPQQEKEDPSLERDLPYDIEEAIISAVVSGYESKGSTKEVSSISVGDGTTSFVTSTDHEETSNKVPKYFMDVVSNYKRVEVV